MSRHAGSPTPYVLGFLVIALLALGGNWRLDLARRDGRHTASTINDQLRQAEQGLSEFRGAQAGYLIDPAQTEEWLNRGAAASAQLERAINALIGVPGSAVDAQPHYQLSATLVSELVTIDKKARGYVVSGQPLVASDLIFREGGEPAKKLAAELAAARTAEMASFEQSAILLGRIGLGANAAALGIGWLLLLIAVRGRTDPNADAPAEGLSLNAAPSAPEPKVIAPPEPDANPFAAPSVDLTGAAELCVDLGRILDGRDLPALMERAAGVLEAKGLVLWVSEAAGTVLRPTVAYGYSDRVLQRMGTLAPDGDNVTSLAFRSMQPQVLRSSLDGHGALAVPLITSGGCVGVLAAEVQGAKPGDVRFAVARMIAAQLSTLVGPGSSAPAKTAGASN